MAEPSSVLEQKDHGDPKSSDNSAQDPGEALAKFDFAHTNLGTQGPDYSDAHAALASMSSDDALDYAISQMGPADHLDVEHFDTPADCVARHLMRRKRSPASEETGRELLLIRTRNREFRTRKREGGRS